MPHSLVPKKRRKTVYGKLRKELGTIPCIYLASTRGEVVEEK